MIYFLLILAGISLLALGVYRSREFYRFVQRGKRGYADYDLNNFDNYLALLLSQAIRQLSDSAAHPSTVTEQQWKKILEEMAVGFESANNIIGLLDTQEADNRNRELFNRGINLFHKYYFNLWA